MGIELLNQSYRIKCLEIKISAVEDLARDLKDKIHSSTLIEENEQEKLEYEVQEIIDFIKCSK